MNSETEPKKSKKEKDAQVEEVGGMRGWLLKKAKTFMWDAASNKLILPKGVVLTKEEKKALEEMIGEFQDEAEEFEKRKREHMLSAMQAGVKYKANVVEGYSVLFSSSYRELTGVLAHKIHDNLQGMLQVNMRYLSGMWKAISGATKTQSKGRKAPSMTAGRGGR